MAKPPEGILLYGANGYTGRLIALHAKNSGIDLTIAGRSESRLSDVAKETGFDIRVGGLHEARDMLDGIAVVLHCAGPFAVTSKPMVDACIEKGVHYLDITGEVAVFEACAARHQEAEQAGVMLMPGVGFDVVPSDCLALHLKERLPTATHLTLGFRSVGPGSPSHGTATTAVRNLGQPNVIRQDGRLTPVRLGKLTRTIDFGRGPESALGIPWGDVSTAFHTTAIPNIAVYLGMPSSAIRFAKLGGVLGRRLSLIEGVAQRRIDARPAGPTDRAREASHVLLWGEATDGEHTVASRLKVPEGYTLTSRAALDIAQRVAQGQATPGFRTPAQQYGATYVLGLPGVGSFEEHEHSGDTQRPLG